MRYTKGMEDSIFTKIIRGKIPSHKVYEDERTYAFLDIHPISAGHTLVVPKKQVEFLWDLDDADYQALMKTVKHLGAHLRSTLDIPHVGVQVIGVDVPHAHVHLVPFTTVDEYRAIPDMNSDPDHDVLAAVAKQIAL